MTSPNDTYTSPLAERNASPEMLRLWSPRHKFNTWRRIWLAVAEAQHELGLPVTKEQVEELRAVVERKNPDGSVGITDAEIELAKKYERELRHDVMSHVHALGDACPKAKGIIHLGMTSQDVVCNADILVFNEALRLIVIKLTRALVSLANQAQSHTRVPTLGYTHYQAAQPCTVGRRISQWAYELYIVYERVSGAWTLMPLDRMRGLRGATGTQAAFLSLLVNNHAGVDELEARFVEELLEGCSSETFSDERLRHTQQLAVDGAREDSARAAAEGKGGIAEAYDSLSKQEAAVPPDRLRQQLIDRIRHHNTYDLTTQTYPRVVDTFILADLASVACVLHKIATDIRLLCNRKELDEPFEDKQIGSSAMPYKRNPMRCERICGLTRFVMNLVGNAYDTAATQWLERTLDDSSNRRLSLPEAFLALDGALDLMHNVASGLVVHEATVRKNLMAELPFMATENLLMECVKLGGDRQEYHELIRRHAQAAGMRVKQEGLDNDLIDRLKGDKSFWGAAGGGPLRGERTWVGLLEPMKSVGRSGEQTERFIREVVEPLREQYGDAIAKLGDSGPKV